MRRFACLAAMLSLGLLAFGASTASAAPDTVISWFGGGATGCRDGTATVPAGNIYVRFGWATNSVARTQKFLDYSDLLWLVDGYGNYSDTWGPITQGLGDLDGDGVPESTVYVTTWNSPLLTVLNPGQSATITLSLKASKTIWDTDKISYKAGTELLGSFTSCTITAV